MKKLLLLLPILLAGCLSSPTVSTLDRTLFDITTNQVPSVHVVYVPVTNWVQVPFTNPAPLLVVTNTVYLPSTSAGGSSLLTPIVVLFTNHYTTISQPSSPLDFESRAVITDMAVTVSNLHQMISVSVKPKVEALAAGTAGILASPSGWGSVASAGVAGLLALFAAQRQKALNKANGQTEDAQAAAAELAHNVEVARKLFALAAATPQGVNLSQAYKRWLQDHQAAAGVIDGVTAAISSGVDPDAAQLAALKISGKIS